jgi:hypothetical protein
MGLSGQVIGKIPRVLSAQLSGLAGFAGRFVLAQLQELLLASPLK